MSKNKNITKFIVATSYKDNFVLTNQKYDNSANFKYTKPCMRVVKSDWDEYSCCDAYGCTYAHSLQELRVPECLYGDRCYKKDGPCNFIHPSETKDQYFKRTGKKLPDLPLTSENTYRPGFAEPTLENVQDMLKNGLKI